MGGKVCRFTPNWYFVRVGDLGVERSDAREPRTGGGFSFAQNDIRTEGERERHEDVENVPRQARLAMERR